MQRIIKYCKQKHIFSAGDGVVIGLSGGADSVCLLLVLTRLRKELGLKLCAVHVNHGIRGADADADADFSRALCEKHDVDFVCEKADIPLMSSRMSMSEEEMGRSVRYRCFRDVMKQRDYQKIAVAHHQNDLAETMLFHMARGTGPDGLSPMQPLEGDIARPLLCVTRKDIEEILAEYRQDYCQDRTNDDTRYTRNYIRHEMTDRLLQVNKNAIRHMAALSDKLGDMNTFVKQYTADAFREGTDLLSDRVLLSIEYLQGQYPYIQQELVRKCIYHVLHSLKDVRQVHVTRSLELTKCQNGKKICLPDDVIVIKEYENLVFMKGGRAADAGCMFDVMKETVIDTCKDRRLEYTLPGHGILVAQHTEKISDADKKKKYTKYFNCDKIKNTLVVRYPKKGDYIVINNRGQKKLLRRYFIDKKIPARLRDHMCVVADGSHIVWIPGYRVSEEYKPTEEMTELLKLTIKGDAYDETN